MKSNTSSTELQDDKVAAIGIGAMIVFIALILVAAVAAAVIIQTAEALQQNAQQTGDDTADNMAGKVKRPHFEVDRPRSRGSNTSSKMSHGGYNL